jgi:hypothetical protein
MARAYRDDLPDGHREIFLRKGLDTPNQIELPDEIGFCAHAISQAAKAETLNVFGEVLSCPSCGNGTRGGSVGRAIIGKVDVAYFACSVVSMWISAFRRAQPEGIRTQS